jgi:uncharacterized protein
MRSVKQIVKTLGLKDHPEGGYYKEMYRSNEMISKAALPPGFEGNRNFSTSIFFLLPSDKRSVFHRIKSDELWFFHEGSSLSIYVIENNDLKILKLGSNMEAGESYQHKVPANCWFGSLVNESNSYSLCSCTVSPGFDFMDFEIAERNTILAEFPRFEKEILLLTH